MPFPLSISAQLISEFAFYQILSKILLLKTWLI
jgi:hypothetical protein